jgi:hypothetical protein
MLSTRVDEDIKSASDTTPPPRPRQPVVGVFVEVAVVVVVVMSEVREARGAFV